MSDMLENGAECSYFLKVYLGAIDALMDKGLEGKDAAEQANLFFSSYVTYAIHKNMEDDVSMTFIADEDN